MDAHHDLGGSILADFRRPTRRSLLLGLYFRFKSVLWACLGLALGWGFFRAGELGARDAWIFIADYTLLFLIPCVLLWVLSIAVRARHPISWWFAVVYLLSILASKASIGATDLPWAAWSWVSSRLPSHYLQGLAAFGVLCTLVLAFDIAALVGFISIGGRECYGIGKEDKASSARER